MGGSRGKYVRNAILDIHINLSYRLKLSKKHFALMKRKLNMKLGAMLPKKFGQMDLYCPLTVLAFILLRRSRELTTPPPTSEKGRRKFASSRVGYAFTVAQGRRRSGTLPLLVYKRVGFEIAW